VKGQLLGHFLRALLLSFTVVAGLHAGPLVRFFAIGDVPYNDAELMVLETFLGQELKKGTPFVVHVGDIKGGREPCSDERLKVVAELFRTQPVPVVYTPGDNEWTDCHRAAAGGYDPLERLAAVRRLFYGDPGVLKVDALAVVRPDAAFPENYYFLYRDVLFVTVHAVGSHNNRKPRDPAAMAEFEARTAADRRLLQAVAAAANARHAKAVILAFQADPGFEKSKPPNGFAPLWQDLRTLLRDFRGPILAIHGDSHTYTFDHPLKSATTGEREGRFVRLEVPGSPVVGGVWVTVEPTAPEPFKADPVYPDAHELLMGE
jgi:hypothetical protein